PPGFASNPNNDGTTSPNMPSYALNPFPYPYKPTSALSTALFAGRGRGFNNDGRNFSNNNGGNGENFNKNNYGLIRCQLCGKNGHGAKTCNMINNISDGNAFTPKIECQFCGENNHIADKCFFIFGFSNQNQQNYAPTQTQNNQHNNNQSNNSFAKFL
ncbi:hypothetical protein Dimus_035337, partial [Dionaea muscipula]